MKKNLFIKSTIILLVGSLFTKLLGFIIKILFTRIIGTDGINLYSLVMPTYSLVIALTQLGLPMAVSTIVAKGVKRGKTVVVSIIPIILVINIIMMFILINTSGFIANDLLHEPFAKYPIMSMSLILPFVSISSILRGYYFGKQNMLPHTVSNIIEQVVRLLIIIILLPALTKYGPIVSISGFILFNIISEIISILVFLLYLPKGNKLKIQELKPDIDTSREVLNICIPTISGRIIGNIAYFLEPVILTYVLSKVGYSKDFIVGEYAIYNAYVIPLLVIPSFIVQSISISLIPEISKLYQNKNIKGIKKRLNQALGISLVLGIITNTFVFLFPEYLLSIIYNTTSGINYLKVLSLFFILYNLEGPLFSALQALNKTKLAFRTTTISIIIKTLIMTILSYFKIGLYGLIISEIIDILYVIVKNYININNIINKKHGMFIIN